MKKSQDYVHLDRSESSASITSTQPQEPLNQQQQQQPYEAQQPQAVPLNNIIPYAQISMQPAFMIPMFIVPGPNGERQLVGTLPPSLMGGADGASSGQANPLYEQPTYTASQFGSPGNTMATSTCFHLYHFSSTSSLFLR
eukprot:TRINITY_DN3718_c0_g1_i1.p2 TRINITY_DN3718_c0_g1~~TRINITY_DN3718_c0_g1_i1.p2  ORF type:complete len:140 (+),score=30.97 TRINITY_DN3718_c0_g1_i1:104-523(+)